MSESSIRGKSLKVKRQPDGTRKLLRDLTVKPPSEKNPITVKAGFVTDFSSIPTTLHWIMRWSRVDVAGVVHDWLYRQPSYTRRQADRIWRETARTSGHSANWLQAYIGWLALAVYGGFAHKVKKDPLWLRATIVILSVGVCSFGLWVVLRWLLACYCCSQG